VIINGVDASGLAPRERGIGFVFQHYALFRHMTVAGNIAFGLRARPRRRRPGRGEIRRRVAELLALMQLEGLGDRFPPQLSGGQRQRVAFARALAVEPSVLLLDEPFGALDAKVREELRTWLRDVHRRLGVTTLFVTHDQEEALLLAERVAVMDRGRMIQVGRPAEVYDRPASPFVTEFLGAANRFEAELRGGQAFVGGRPVPLARSRLAGLRDGRATIFVRPHEIRLGGGGFPVAEIEDVATLGPRSLVRLTYAGLRLKAEVARGAEADLAPGRRVAIEFSDALVFPEAEPGAAPAGIPRRFIA
jgi:sulfate transport system ATP-binding protein